MTQRTADGIAEAHRRHPARVGEPAAREREWQRTVQAETALQPPAKSILAGGLSHEDADRRAALRELLQRGPLDA
jgi:hypothetical protein